MWKVFLVSWRRILRIVRSICVWVEPVSAAEEGATLAYSFNSIPLCHGVQNILIVVLVRLLTNLFTDLARVFMVVGARGSWGCLTATWLLLKMDSWCVGGVGFCVTDGMQQDRDWGTCESHETFWSPVDLYLFCPNSHSRCARVQYCSCWSSGKIGREEERELGGLVHTSHALVIHDQSPCVLPNSTWLYGYSNILQLVIEGWGEKNIVPRYIYRQRERRQGRSRGLQDLWEVFVWDRSLSFLPDSTGSIGYSTVQ